MADNEQMEDGNRPLSERTLEKRVCTLKKDPNRLRSSVRDSFCLVNLEKSLVDEKKAREALLGTLAVSGSIFRSRDHF